MEQSRCWRSAASWTGDLYIEKPWDNGDLLIILRNALEKRRLMKQLQTKLGEIDQASPGGGIVASGCTGTVHPPALFRSGGDRGDEPGTDRPDHGGDARASAPNKKQGAGQTPSFTLSAGFEEVG